MMKFSSFRQTTPSTLRTEQQSIVCFHLPTGTLLYFDQIDPSRHVHPRPRTLDPAVLILALLGLHFSLENLHKSLIEKVLKMRKIMKHCNFYFFETLGIVFQKYSGRCFYHTLPNVSNIKKSQCLTETSNSSLSKKDLAIFRGKTMPNLSQI